MGQNFISNLFMTSIHLILERIEYFLFFWHTCKSAIFKKLYLKPNFGGVLTVQGGIKFAVGK